MRSAARYYEDATPQYGRYAGAARGWHFGVWEKDVRTHQQALLRADELLLRGLAVDSRTRVLDVGFGVGGFSTGAARRHGAQLTGVTLSASHVHLARRLAAERGVGARCSFLVADMDRAPFRDRRFDVVVNEETFCHSAQKRRYVSDVFRLLVPGGVWRAIDFAVRDEPLSSGQREELAAVLGGFHIPDLASRAEIESMLREASFSDIETRDVTPLVLRGADVISRRCRAPLLLMRLGLDWIIFSREPGKRSSRRGHVTAAAAYCRGLREGYFRHVWVSARRPTAG
jgi:cyclopropane fatty-acyl-phospholipid synthase-like methyltransferase